MNRKLFNTIDGYLVVQEIWHGALQHLVLQDPSFSSSQIFRWDSAQQLYSSLHSSLPAV